MTSRSRATIKKGVYGLIVRVAQGALLFVGVAEFSARERSDLAVGLVAVQVLNLVTNFGIPTLLIRSFSYDLNVSAVVLIRSYILLTCGGMLIIGFAGLSLFDNPAFAAAVAILFFGTSCISALEYWALGSGSYDSFLRGPAVVHGALSVMAAPAAVLSGSASIGIVILACATLLPFATKWAARSLRSIGHSRGDSRNASWAWVSSAIQIGLATVGATILYGADVFILRFSGWVGEDAVYRLAISGVNLFVGLLPASFFVLKDVASGIEVTRGFIVGCATCVAFLSIGAGVLGWRLEGPVRE
ncbi:MAG: hypothetical protein M3198_00040, partial [Actinomycetota bacterium]|nr:hypothetical protein [Actinomycetota bacterium]